MLDERNPEYAAARRRFDGVISTFQAKAERLQEDAAARRAEVAKQQERFEKERQQLVDRARDAKKAKAEGKPDAEKAQPENAWAQPTRLPDSGARIGRFDDEDALPAPAAEPAPEPPKPAMVPPPPPPAVKEEPEPPRARHAAYDDDDDFESGSFLRG